jgi:mono/diheme cytochrome c family protein
MLKSLLLVFATVLFGITGSSASGPAPQEATAAPASGVKNPVRPTEKSLARAKELYGQDCAICHGETGDGKTELAKGMELTLGDWTDPKTLSDKPDGDLFSAIRNGKGKMPSEAEGRAKDSEVWNIILYIRSMGKQQAAATPAPSN